MRVCPIWPDLVKNYTITTNLKSFHIKPANFHSSSHLWCVAEIKQPTFWCHKKNWVNSLKKNFLLIIKTKWFFLNYTEFFPYYTFVQVRPHFAHWVFMVELKPNLTHKCFWYVLSRCIAVKKNWVLNQISTPSTELWCTDLY